MSNIRTRIAPSPTGDPHVGTAYIALFNRCFAHSQGGEFILRIEDTDQVRSNKESEQAILDSLRWLGLQWDEGPDLEGDYGPYRQSERSDIYQQHITPLLEHGHAFHCFCSSERLTAVRKEQMANKQQAGYDGHCLSLNQEDIKEKMAAGESYVIRMRIPEEGSCIVNDLLRGEIEIEWQQVDMQVLMKADGLPTYHFANVVDDHLMGISHVIRGEEWINSLPKHVLLYEYFGWQQPVFCHLPLLRNPDKSKLSKRKNPTSITYYERMGYLPEALLNYLGMMGWTMPDGEEKFTLQQMQAHFDLKRISLGAPVFDVEKLDWLNGRWIRENLDVGQFAQRVHAWALNSDYLSKIIPLIHDRVEKFTDIAPLTALFLFGMPDINEASFQHKKLDIHQQRKILQFALWHLEAEQQWCADRLESGLKALAEAMDFKLREFLGPMFVALSGKSSSTPLFASMEILGMDISRARVRYALNTIGAVSKKETKRWEKEFKSLAYAA